MLSEKIEKSSDLADREGILFVFKSLLSGVTSIDALSKLRLHNSGKINVNIELTLELFHLLKLLDFNSNKTIFANQFLRNNIHNEVDFEFFFTKALLNFLLYNGYIDRSKIVFDDVENNFIFLRSAIKYKYASLRNLMLSFDMVKKRYDGSYILNSSFLDLLQNNNLEIQKLNEKKLFELLELQRNNGELGENFVLEYERKRLLSHKEVNKIKRISNVDVCAGYDILSFNDQFSESLSRFIEVKTYSGRPHFYWSKNEINVARLRHINYYLYLVDISKINDFDYIPHIICDPNTYFASSDKWVISAQSYLYELIS